MYFLTNLDVVCVKPLRTRCDARRRNTVPCPLSAFCMRLKSRLSEADTGPLVLTSIKEAKYYQAVLQPPEYESKQLQTCRESVLLCGSNFEHCWKSTDQWTMRCHRRMTDVSTRLTLLAGFILTVGLTLSLGSNQHVGFTFLLPAGSTECFFQTTARDDTMEVEYQVNTPFSQTCLH